jgi:hypothetical protein
LLHTFRRVKFIYSWDCLLLPQTHSRCFRSSGGSNIFA